MIWIQCGKRKREKKEKKDRVFFVPFDRSSLLKGFVSAFFYENKKVKDCLSVIYPLQDHRITSNFF